MAETPTSHVMRPAEPEMGLGEYRPVSLSAVLGLVCGLASPSAIASPVFWFFPLASVVLSVAALVAIQRADKSLAGRPAALIGLFLGVTFLAAGPSRFVSHRAFVRAEARRVAEEWIQHLLAGNEMLALQWTREPTQRGSENESELRAQLDGNPERRRDLEDFHKQEAVRRLFRLGKARVTHEGVVEHSSSEAYEEVLLRYRIVPGDADIAPFSLEIQTRRRPNRITRRGDWLIPDPPRVLPARSAA